MGYRKKCPSCNSCLDMVWILPNRFYHCWLEDIWYNIIEEKMVIINIFEATGITSEQLNILMENYEQR